MAEAEEEKPAGLVRTLFGSLWFPSFFVVGFLVFYLVPFHAPAPHGVEVAVAGPRPAAELAAGFEQKAPGAYDITPVADGTAARRAVLDRDAVAGYDPASHTLYLAKADGQSLVQALQTTFTPVAAQGGGHLRTVDVVPTASGDVTGAGLFYLLMVANLCGYIAVMMLMQATTLGNRRKLGVIAGFGAAASVLAFAVGSALDVIPANLALLPVLFLLTQAVGWTTFGLAPLVRQYIPGVAMGLFVLMSIPSSGGAIPVQMVPAFFRFLHPLMPLGQTIEAARGVLYFHGTGIGWPLFGLACWFLAGVALVTFNEIRTRTAAAEEPDAALFVAEVRDTLGQPVMRGTVTLTSLDGTELARADLAADGIASIPLTEIEPQPATAVISAPPYHAAAERVSLGADTTRLEVTLTTAAKPAATLNS